MITEASLIHSFSACVNEFFQNHDKESPVREDKSSKDEIYKEYRAVLDSKSSDETLVSYFTKGPSVCLEMVTYMHAWLQSQALFASWEPRHSRHCYSFPWEQYVKLGAIIRHFGYTAVALHGCLESEIQVQNCRNFILIHLCFC